MDYHVTCNLQKCLFLNVYVYSAWVPVSGFFLYTKFHLLGHLTKYLSVAIFVLLVVIECLRLCLGYYGNLSCRVPELAGFMMLTVLMQIPLVSFFIFNPFLLNTPTEMVLNMTLWLITVAEVLFSYLALKRASDIAKNTYLMRPKSR